MLNKTPLSRAAALPVPILFCLFFAAVALGHLTLLHLPYFWDCLLYTSRCV